MQELSVSVIMPTYNKARYLQLTLASFVRQTHANFEIVIVDDGGTDQTESVIRRYSERLRIKYLRQPNRGRAAARNLALGSAAGDILLFSDDDRIVVPDFVAAHAREFTDAVKGPQVVGWQGGILSWWLPEHARSERLDGVRRANPELIPNESSGAVQLVTESDIERDIAATTARYGFDEAWWRDYCEPILEAYPDPQHFRLSWALGNTGNMSATRRQVLEAGLFDEQFLGWGLEDMDLSYRLARVGAPVAVSRSALSYHQVHPTVETRLDEWGQNFVRFANKFDEMGPLIFCLLIQKRIGAQEADALLAECEQLLLSGRGRVVKELKGTLRQLLGVGTWR
jgi:glycosyltransferase involved in cell wall biosynthesis